MLLSVVVGFLFGLGLVANKTHTKLEVLIQGLLHHEDLGHSERFRWQ